MSVRKSDISRLLLANIIGAAFTAAIVLAMIDLYFLTSQLILRSIE